LQKKNAKNTEKPSVEGFLFLPKELILFNERADVVPDSAAI
jgi:hypothetical protein